MSEKLMLLLTVALVSVPVACGSPTDPSEDYHDISGTWTGEQIRHWGMVTDTFTLTVRISQKRGTGLLEGTCEWYHNNRVSRGMSPAGESCDVSGEIDPIDSGTPKVAIVRLEFHWTPCEEDDHYHPANGNYYAADDKLVFPVSLETHVYVYPWYVPGGRCVYGPTGTLHDGTQTSGYFTLYR